MAQNSILQEFLVELGFDVKSDEYKKFVGALDNVTKWVVTLSTALGVGTAAIETLVKKSSDHFADLYYAGQRVGDSVANLEAWKYGAQQAGVVADQAMGAIEGFSRAIRLQPGLQGVLKGFGIDLTESKTAQLVDLINKLRTLPPAVAAQYGNMFGIDPDTLLMLEQKLPQIAAGIDSYAAKLKKAGVNADELAEKSRAFSLAWANFDTDIGNLAAKIEDDFMPAATALLGWADKAVVKFGQLDVATGGWAGRIAGVAATVAGYFGLKGVLSSLFGGGAGAVAAGSAGAGATTAAGGASIGSSVAALGGGGAAGTLAAGGGGAALLGFLAPLAAFLGGVFYPSSTQTQAQENAGIARWNSAHQAGATPAPGTGVLALIRKLEASGDSAVSPRGAIGRYQIMPGTARSLGGDPGRLTDPAYAEGIAKSAIKDILAQGAKTLDEVLVGYNSSPAFLRKFIGSGDNPAVLLPETQKYLANAHKILAGDSGLLSDIENSRLFGAGSGLFSSARIGAGGVTLNVDARSQIQVNGSGSPKEVAEEVGRAQARVYGDAVRDSIGAVH